MVETLNINWMRIDVNHKPHIIYQYPCTICPKCNKIIDRPQVRITPIYKETSYFIEVVDWCGDTYRFYYEYETRDIVELFK